MLRKLTTIAAVLALVLAACVPALAQLEGEPRFIEPAEGSSLPPIPIDPESEVFVGDIAYDCRFLPEDSPDLVELCLENGITPQVLPNGANPVEAGLVQYNPEPPALEQPVCLDYDPRGFCTVTIYPDGTEFVRQ